MIVSLGIFTIVALVAVGALMKIMDANKKSIALKTAINNMNFTLESISREMRVGKNYQCCSGVGSPDDNNNLTPTLGTNTVGPSGGWTIAFNSSKTKPWLSSPGSCHLIYAYKFIPKDGTTNAKIQKAQQTICEFSIADDDFHDLISAEVNIDKSIVSVDNSNQPYATFFFHGMTGVKAKEQAEFTVQTSVSQRLPR